MEKKNSTISSFEPASNEIWTAGGPVWINLANTIALAGKGMPDIAGSLNSLGWWLGIMGLPAPGKLGPDDLAFTAELRKSFSHVIDSIQLGSPIGAGELKLLNSVLRKQQEWYELCQLDTGVMVRRALRATATIEQALGPAVQSLSETLVDGDLTRLRTCAHPDCELRFYDDSKNGTRRWCTMSGCGNRAKAAAYLQRRKKPA